jgi:hypothetical protein
MPDPGFFRGVVGSRFVRVGRSVDILLFEFSAGAGRFKLHTQCPARVRRDSVVLVGSDDIRRPADEGEDPGDAFDSFTTVYDERARELERRLAARDCRVMAATLLPPGMVVVELDDGSTVEVLPASSTDTEAWRTITPDGDYQVYPEDFAGW